MDHLINIPLDFMSPVCRLQNAAVFILVFMSACLHIGKALIFEILVKDAASLAYKERSSRRCIGEGCLDDLNFDKFCCRCGLVTRPREWGEAADRFQVEMSEMEEI